MRVKNSLRKEIARVLIITLVAGIGLTSATPVSTAATTIFINDTDAPLAFVKSASTNIVGTGGTAVNDVVLYKTVGTYGGVAIDAVITTLSISGAITNYDNPGSASTAAGSGNNFMINTTGGEARLRFEFFRAGTYTGANTGIPVVLQNVKITSIDLDCSSAAGSFQYTDATGFQKYSMMSPTNLAVKSMASPNRVRFIANKAGSRSSVPEDQVMLKYDAVQTVEFSFGNVIAGSTNFFGLVFGGWPNGGSPVEYTNVFNTPPTSTDTTMNASGATILSLANFGTYADADNNPFFSIKFGAPTNTGTLEFYNGSSWVSVTTGQSVLVSDIEKGFLRFTPGVNTPSAIPFNVNDGLEFSTTSNTLTITKVSNAQIITFANPGTKGSSSGSFSSGATTNATGLTVVLTSLTPGVCTVSSLNIVPVSAGTCVIVASQPGDSTYGAAAPVTREFAIISGSAPTETQTITFTAPATQVLDSATVASGASSLASNSTSLIPTLTSNTPSICTISGLTINLVKAGTCTVTASQAGTSVIAPAENVTRSFSITAGAGGGTVPATQTLGSGINNAADKIKLYGYVEVNSATTTYQFCYSEAKPSSTSVKILAGTTSSQLYCTSTATTASDAAVATAEINFQSNSTSSSRINSGSTVYFQIIAYHSASDKVYGAIMNTSTSSGYVTTSPVTNLLEKSATLNGTAKNSSSKSSRNLNFCVNSTYNVLNRTQLANSDGKCDFKFTSNPATLDKSASTSSAAASATGLSSNTVYYYQLSISSSSKTSYGNIVRFKTSSAAPVVTTLGTNGYNNTGATINGSILTNDNTITPKFCYSETPTATSGVLTEANCAGGLLTANPSSISSGTKSISLDLTGLTSGKTYYYQAIATYGVSSKVYGAIKSFTFGAPAATTLTATDVKITSGVSWEAGLNGFVNPNGSTSTNYFCLAETNTVTAKGAMTQCVTGGGVIAIETATAEIRTTSGPISLAKTGLTAGTTYYYQAVGRNLGVTPSLDSFGEVLSFITANAPTVTTEDVLAFGVETATVRGTLTANGALTAGTFCLSTSDATTAIDGVLDSCLSVLGSTPSTTSTTLAITADAVGLSQATTYYYQAIGDNSQGTAYGSIKSFTTLAGAPIATTVAATSVLGTTATLNGRVNSGGASTTVKFCYGTSSSLTSCTLSPTVTTIAGSAGLTPVAFNVESLTSNTRYYFRVVAENVVNGATNTINGIILSFKTGSPFVKTLAASSVAATSAVLNGTAKANGSNVSNVKFCLSDATTVSASGELTCNQSSPLGSFNATPASFSSTVTIDNPESATVSGLTSGTTYYFQIQATNGQGTTYGEVLSFTAGAPIGVTELASQVTASTGRLNGTFNKNNDGAATASFCLSDSEELNADGSLASCLQSQDVESSLSVSSTSNDPVYVDVADLSAGNTYFFQIKTTGTNGSSIGEVLNFSTGYSVTFLANGGSGSMSAQSAISASALTTNTFTKASSTFAGWATTASGSVAYANGAQYSFAANLTLYALWTAVVAPAPTPAPTPAVTKKKMKIKWNNPSSIFFGTPLSGKELNAEFEIPGICVYTPALGTLLAVGNHTLSVTCTPTDGENYEPVTTTVTIEVKKGKGKPRIIWFNPSAITSPAPLTSTQLSAVANVPGKYVYNPALGTVLTVGKHPLNVKFTPDNQEEYENMEANVTISVLEKKTIVEEKPKAPVTAPDTVTVTTPAAKPEMKTAGIVEVVTVQQNQEKTGIIVSSESWSLAIKSTTQFVQGSVTDTSARVVIEKGNTVTTSGTGFKPNSQVDVYVYSTPTWLGSVITDEFGNFTTTLPMPTSLPEGDHTFQAQGLTPDNNVRTAAVPITLVPAAVVIKPGSLRFEVYFAMNSTAISKAQKAKIVSMVKMALAKAATTANISTRVEGWVQPNPNPGNVKFLSTNRAKNVRTALKAAGLRGTFTLKFPGLERDNVPRARHASVIIEWSQSK